MLLNKNTDPLDHSYCRLSYNEAEGWLQNDWVGYVGPQEAQHGAESFLRHAARHPSPYLLNDNSLLQGPWFDSLDWLARVWLPLAEPLGLRYVAHVVQADTHTDVLTRQLSAPLPFDFQVFERADDARHWLRSQRAAEAAPAAGPGQGG